MTRARFVRVALVTMIAAGAASCSGTGDGPTGSSAPSAVATLFRGTSEAQEPITDQLPDAARCPNVRVQPQTETIRRDDGSGDPQKLRWQATLTRTARECDTAADGAVTMRIGVAGRVIQGPGGAPSEVELPVRIAVRESNEVTASRVHSVSVQVTGASLDWAYVEENVVVRSPATAEIVVGFDG